MTILTGIGGRDVGGILTGRRGSVVTARTVRGDAGVIEARGCPGVGAMTKVTGVVTGDMRSMLTGGCSAVVTAEAGADDVRMVDPDNGSPGGVAMTIFAHVGRVDVCCVLAGRRNSIMTA